MYGEKKKRSPQLQRKNCSKNIFIYNEIWGKNLAQYAENGVFFFNALLILLIIHPLVIASYTFA